MIHFYFDCANVTFFLAFHGRKEREVHETQKQFLCPQLVGKINIVILQLFLKYKSITKFLKTKF